MSVTRYWLAEGNGIFTPYFSNLIRTCAALRFEALVLRAARSACTAPLGWAPTAAWACDLPKGLSFITAFPLMCCQVVVSPQHP